MTGVPLTSNNLSPTCNIEASGVRVRLEKKVTYVSRSALNESILPYMVLIHVIYALYRTCLLVKGKWPYNAHIYVDGD